MTMTEKIMARASERPQLNPGENVWVNVDILMTHDICGPGSIGIFKREFGENAKVLNSLWLIFVFNTILNVWVVSNWWSNERLIFTPWIRSHIERIISRYVFLVTFV